MTDLPIHPPVGGQVLDAGLHLLDRQVVDSRSDPVSYVGDLELSDWSASDPVVIESLVMGSGLVARFFGGRPPLRRLYRVAWRDVAKVGITVELGVDGAGLDIMWSEAWVRGRIISHIPGGDHAAE
jgi:hypothetical protein